MNRRHSNSNLPPEDESASPFRIARFPESLGLPPGEPESLQQAAKAVRQEYRDCSKWKKLYCEKVSVVAESDRGIVHVVHVEGAVDFDWTWEGAIAFRPRSESGLLDTQAYSDPESVEQSALWSGEILEVDEASGCIFVSLDNPEVTPVTGEFCVRPFEFLAALNSIYHDEAFEVARVELLRRLAASCGNIHPPTQRESKAGIPDLTDWWQHSWSVLWGPPGTGKTWLTGQQVASVLKDPAERILVVSTTNQATDSAAVSIGKAARDDAGDGASRALESGEILRIGKGAAWQTFRDDQLMVMLKGTESDLLASIDSLNRKLSGAETGQDRAVLRMQIQDLRDACVDRSKQVFYDSDARVVVATAFKAITMIKDELLMAMLNENQAPFTTVVIDEAGLISRAAVAALSLLASDRVVLVGDSKQLAPISRIARIMPSHQAKWLASSGLSHLENIDFNPPAVHVLSEQHRMHPDVCQIVSDFQYGGKLTTAEPVYQRPSALPASIEKFARAIWYVLDEEDIPIDQIRSSRGPANKSWVREGTFSVLQKLFEDDAIKRSHGLFISPFRAQAQSVASLLGRWKARSWESSTVHSQQGSESDIVVFDTVNAGNVTWPVHEWQRLVNVALSRAREAIVVIASRSEMEEPHLRTLLSSQAGSLRPAILRRVGGAFEWTEVSVGGKSVADKVIVHESKMPYTTTGSRAREEEFVAPDFVKPLRPKAESTGTADASDSAWTPKHKLGQQFSERKKMRPILSQEQQRLSELELDGKPRLIRGVAGSGKSMVLSNWVARTAERINASLDDDFRIWAVYANRSLHKLLQDSIESAWKTRQENQLFTSQQFPWKNVSLLHVKDILEAVLPETGMSISSFGFDYDVAAESFLAKIGGQQIEARCSALFIDEAQDMGPSMLRLLLSLVRQEKRGDRNSRSAHIFYDNAQNLYGVRTPKWSDYGLEMRGRSSIMRESFRATKPIIEYAVNVLDHLSETEEHRELLELKLLKEVTRGGEPWLQIEFNQVGGPQPLFQSHVSVEAQLQAMGDHLIHLLAAEDVSLSSNYLINTQYTNNNLFLKT